MKTKLFAYALTIFSLSLMNVSASEETQNYERYLNQLKTLSGDFTQTSSKGNTVTGTIQISRPGKMRLTYNPPSTLLIVANGKWLITKDTESDQVDYVSLDKTPAAFILRPHIRFSGDVEITNVVPKGELTEVSLIRTEEPDAGYITLVFQDNPIALKEWSVIDAQGIETRVTLSNLKSNVQLTDGIFHFETPNLIQQIF
jgi:outer membrane lipoprotein-sorting protein